MKKNKKTLNAQRSTFNVQLKEGAGSGSALHFDPAEASGSGRVEERSQFDLEDRLLEFTAQLIKLVDSLPTSRAGSHIAAQLLRCGTSPFANHGEVQASESRRDFIHKLSICLKELKEVRRWLRLVVRVELLSLESVRPLLLEKEELIGIFSASIRTAERNAR